MKLLKKHLSHSGVGAILESLIKFLKTPESHSLDTIDLTNSTELVFEKDKFLTAMNQYAETRKRPLEVVFIGLILPPNVSVHEKLTFNITDPSLVQDSGGSGDESDVYMSDDD